MDQSSPQQTPTTYLKDYKEPEFLIERVELEFNLDPERTVVKSRLQCQRNGQHNEPVCLDGEEMELVEIRLNDELLNATEYRLDEQQLEIINPGNQFTLQITTRIAPINNTALSGLYMSSGNFCTQCEAEGFRRITYYLDRPDVLTKFRVTLLTDAKKYPVLLSNGNLLESRTMPGGMHCAIWDDPHPKPSYLFALVAGDLLHIKDRFTTMHGDDIDLYIYTQHHNIDKCDHAMSSLKNAMYWDEQVYGRVYDLDRYMIVAVDDFNMGAMENKGLNIFNSKYVLAKPETATDQDYENIEGVIAHEYFHNWSGNRVTCRDWFQLSLKEGFTVFRDQEFSADMSSRGVKRVHDVNVLRTHQFKEDASPMAHPVRPQSYQEINNFYTVTVYNKGAEVVRMICNLVGEAGFRQGTDLYFSRHDGQAVTTDDFVKAMEEANAIDLSQFRLWYDQAGTPELAVEDEFDSQTGTYTLTINQHTPETPGQSDKSPFHIPLGLALFSVDGHKQPVNEKSDLSTVLQLFKERQSFHFNCTEKPIPSLLRGFSAPVKISIDRPLQDWFTLMVHDDDPFSRWDAWQQVATAVLTDLVGMIQNDAAFEVPVQFVSAFAAVLSNDVDDRAFQAEMIRLPNQDYLADRFEIVDPDAIYQTRHQLIQHLTEALGNVFENVYQANTVNQVYQPNSEQIGKRSLRNLCLNYLASIEQYHDLARQQFDDASNMTDRISALVALTHHDAADKDQFLQRFYDKWKNDPLVTDKWLSVQAMAPSENIVSEVTALSQHPAFDMGNPNKVRALIGAFAQGNPTGFHQIDGQGYELVANFVIEVDGKNPQMAARLVSAFNMWRRYDHVRQEKMRLEMERILKSSSSRDVKEIISKSLQ